MKYSVTLEYLVRESVEIEADSPAEAAETARHMEPGQVFGQDFDITLPPSSLEDGQPISVYDENGNDCSAQADV